jgi:hypothetical protein
LVIKIRWLFKIHYCLHWPTSNRSDLLQCYKIGIAGYILLKPLKYDMWIGLLNLLNIGVQMS